MSRIEALLAIFTDRATGLEPSRGWGPGPTGGFVARATVRYTHARTTRRQTDRQTDRRRTMKTSAGCDENMKDDDEERRDWHVRVDDKRVERGEGTRGGLEEDAHGDEEDETACKTPTAVRGGAGGFPFGAGGWTPTESDSSTPGSPGYNALHAFTDELFRAWPELHRNSELRVASFREFGELIDKLVQSNERAQYNLKFREIFGAVGENEAYEELARTP